jgi:ABC-type dipeptide/oligopeptide/nickel transport system permease subunit
VQIESRRVERTIEVPMEGPQGLKTRELALSSVELRGDPTWVRFVGHVVRRQPLGVAGGIIVLLLILVAFFTAQLAPYNPKVAIFAIYHSPSQGFFMGTDHLGRDIFSRVVWGARLSLYVGLVSVSVGIRVGALWGIITGYFGGLADSLSQRVVDTLMGFPPLILALSLMAVLQQSVHNVILTLAILLIPTAAPTLRSTTLSLKELGYVESAREMGASH